MFAGNPISNIREAFLGHGSSEVDVPDELGLLRLELAGSWTVRDFIQCLETIERSYLRLNLLYSTGSDIIGARQFSKLSGDEAEQWIQARAAFAGSGAARLRIDRLELASPGFADVVGNLNPLKLIVDLITEWRRENTRRLQIASEERKANEHEQTLRHQAELQAEAKQLEVRIKAGADISKAELSRYSELQQNIRESQVKMIQARLKAWNNV